MNELQFPLSALKKTLHDWLYLENDDFVDVVMAAYIANRLATDPLWLNLIGPPSTSKTELLRAFDGHPAAKFISNITPATLVSGILPKNGRPDPSLLPQLNDKMVVLKDFTTILSMRQEQQTEIIAQLRECYDGQYSKIFGNGKEINWRGKFGLVAACTPVWDKHYGIIGSMGDRFLLYRTEHTDGGRMGLQAQKIVGQEERMRAEISKAVHAFVNQFDKLDSLQFQKDEAVNLAIISLACFVAYGRCAVDRDRNQAVTYQPMPEGTPRLVKQFMQIGMGLSLAYQRRCIDADVYRVVKKIGCDLVPVQRLRLIGELYRTKTFEALNNWRETTDLGDTLSIPGATARLNLEDMMVVGILNRKRGESDGGPGRPPNTWQIKDDVVEWLIAAEVFG